MKNESHTQKVLTVKSKKSFTVYFTSIRKFDTYRSADTTVYTFECAAVDHADAVRQLRMSRMFTVRNEEGKVTKRVRRFKVVRVFSGDSVGHCDCSYCKEHPEFSRKVTVLKSRHRNIRNYFGKGR